MPYILKGRLCGFLCDDCDEPLAGTIVRLYRPAGDNVVELAVAAPRDTQAFLSDDDVEAKADRLLGEARTEADGSYSVQLDEKEYAGGPVEVDLYCPTVPRPKVARKSKPLQVTITTLQPRWRERDDRYFLAVWEYCLSARWWCAILARFGVWTVCGRLVTCEGGVPIPGATVTAFDVDWIQDDPLGSGNTDAGGYFRIYFTADDFKVTPFSPWKNIELIGGPDLYFRAELGGITILQEPSSQGRTPGRENVGHCTCVRLCSKVIVPPDPPTQPHWQQVEDFNIHPAPGTPGAQFSPEGYAGGAVSWYVLGVEVHLL